MSTQEVLQVIEHQACLITLIHLGKVAKAATFVETEGRGVGINGQNLAAETGIADKKHFDVVHDILPDTLMGIMDINCQTSNLHGRIVVSLLGERDTAVNVVPCLLAILVKLDVITEQAIVCNNSICPRIQQQISNGQEFPLIILGLGQEKVIQVLVTTTEGINVVCWFQLLEHKVVLS